MVFAQILRQAAAVLLVGLLAASTASADIAAFNAAIRARDFKAAAAAARETWPTIPADDPQRALIASEFAFASYMADDFAAARDLAAVVMSDPDADASLKSIAAVSHALANLKAEPSNEAADALQAALAARPPASGVDLMTYFGHLALVEYDFTRRRWKAASEAAVNARAFTEGGGDAYAPNVRMFQYLEIVARYLVTRNSKAIAELAAVRDLILADIASAKDDKDAGRFVSHYWQVAAHLASVNSAENSSRKSRRDPPAPEFNERQHRLLSPLRKGAEGAKGCGLAADLKKLPVYPRSAEYKRYVGTVIMAVDVRADGATYNHRLLAAAPEKDFVPAVQKSFEGLTMKPGKDWMEGCSLETLNYVITVQFDM